MKVRGHLGRVQKFNEIPSVHVPTFNRTWMVITHITEKESKIEGHIGPCLLTMLIICSYVAHT